MAFLKQMIQQASQPAPTPSPIPTNQWIWSKGFENDGTWIGQGWMNQQTGQMWEGPGAPPGISPEVANAVATTTGDPSSQQRAYNEAMWQQVWNSTPGSPNDKLNAVANQVTGSNSDIVQIGTWAMNNGLISQNELAANPLFVQQASQYNEKNDLTQLGKLGFTVGAGAMLGGAGLAGISALGGAGAGAETLGAAGDMFGSGAAFDAGTAALGGAGSGAAAAGGLSAAAGGTAPEAFTGGLTGTVSGSPGFTGLVSGSPGVTAGSATGALAPGFFGAEAPALGGALGGAAGGAAGAGLAGAGLAGVAAAPTVADNMLSDELSAGSPEATGNAPLNPDNFGGFDWSSIPQQLQQQLQSVLAPQGGMNWLGLGSDLLGYNAMRDYQQGLLSTMNRAIDYSDPAYAQRGQYQQQFANMQTDPNWMQNDTLLQNMQNESLRNVSAQNAAKGYLNSGNILHDLTRTANETTAKYALPRMQMIGEAGGILGGRQNASGAIGALGQAAGQAGIGQTQQLQSMLGRIPSNTQNTINTGINNWLGGLFGA